jgi:hypothetical protein
VLKRLDTMPHALILGLLLPPCLGYHQPPLPQQYETTSRRSILGAVAVLALSPTASHASYMMQQAAVREQSWEATGRDKERAVYEEIEAALDDKRKFRPDTGTLGYVGGE